VPMPAAHSSRAPSCPSGSLFSQQLVHGQSPWQDSVSLARALSAQLSPLAHLFCPFPAVFAATSGSDELSQRVPFQKVLLVHPDLEKARLLDRDNRTSTQAVLPYTPIPAMLFGGADSGRHAILCLLLADVAGQKPNAPEEDQPRLADLSRLQRRLLALEREAMCGRVVAAQAAQEAAIAEEYCALSVTVHISALCACATVWD
jgi:hypothetical protein